jgi:hypothetical protein
MAQSVALHVYREQDRVLVEARQGYEEIGAPEHAARLAREVGL